MTDKKVEFDWKCPECGHNILLEQGAMMTTAYYPPIYEDGVNINPDRNISTTTYKCLKCNITFTVQSKGAGKSYVTWIE